MAKHTSSNPTLISPCRYNQNKDKTAMCEAHFIMSPECKDNCKEMKIFLEQLSSTECLLRCNSADYSELPVHICNDGVCVVSTQ